METVHLTLQKWHGDVVTCANRKSLNARTHAKVKAPTSCADGSLIKPAAGVRRWGRPSWEIYRPPGEAEPSGSQVHRVCLVQLAPCVVRVQDDVAGLDVPPLVHFHQLVEAAEGDVLCEEGQI